MILSKGVAVVHDSVMAREQISSVHQTWKMSRGMHDNTLSAGGPLISRTNVIGAV